MRNGIIRKKMQKTVLKQGVQIITSRLDGARRRVYAHRRGTFHGIHPDRRFRQMRCLYRFFLDCMTRHRLAFSFCLILAHSLLHNTFRVLDISNALPHWAHVLSIFFLRYVSYRRVTRSLCLILAHSLLHVILFGCDVSNALPHRTHVLSISFS